MAKDNVKNNKNNWPNQMLKNLKVYLTEVSLIVIFIQPIFVCRCFNKICLFVPLSTFDRRQEAMCESINSLPGKTSISRMPHYCHGMTHFNHPRLSGRSSNTGKKRCEWRHMLKKSERVHNLGKDNNCLQKFSSYWTSPIFWENL